MLFSELRMRFSFLKRLFGRLKEGWPDAMHDAQRNSLILGYVLAIKDEVK